MELEPAVQKYVWGKVGKSSVVAQFAAAQSSDELFEIDPKGNYAELWMGTHPNGPSFVRNSANKESLLNFIQSKPTVLGQKARDKFGADIPFLFKILSVQKALSIQVHPDKARAEVLHKNQPEFYKDANHKPEMAIALTPFEMLCGFRSFDEIIQFLQDVPELRQIIGEDLATQLARNKDKETLKKVFTKLMECPDGTVAEKLTQLLSRISQLEKAERDKIEGDLVTLLGQQFPNDVGIWCVYFLQHFTLQPGQAVYLPANEPHAYLQGDCVECMAASDNTVRAGLTPKFKDVKTLCDMLTYKTGHNWIIDGTPFANGSGVSYNPPVDEFSVIKYHSEKPFAMKPHGDSCSIMICVEGGGRTVPQSGEGEQSLKIHPGSVLFLPCESEFSGMQIVPTTGGGPIVIYEAFCTP